jgi:hypothetical protein
MKTDAVYKISDTLYVSGAYVRLFAIILTANLLAKAGVLAGGFAVDDYGFALGFFHEYITLFISQGRLLAAGINYAADSLGVNMTDIYVVFGLLAIMLHSAFVVSILRFVGADSVAGAGLIGALIAVHPYGAEIFTFKVALPYYCVALFFSILALEIVKADPARLRNRLYAISCTLGVLFTYQIFLNYLAVVMIFTWLVGEIVGIKREGDGGAPLPHTDRVKALAIVTLSSVAVFMSAMQALKRFEVVSVDGRSQLLPLSDYSQRADQVVSQLRTVFFESEPIMPGWLKVVALLMLFLSLSVIVKFYLFNKTNSPSRASRLIFVVALLLLVPLSVGMILPFKDWWPVPRVLSHVSLIIGLMFILSEICLNGKLKRHLQWVNAAGSSLLAFGFVLMSNQIFADQARINEWDRAMAIRLISRLEMDDNFAEAKYLHVNGGWWGYPAVLKTVQGDMNTSAFNGPVKVELLIQSTGYNFFPATKGEKAAKGEAYCSSAPKWPAAGSTRIDGDLAIVCLKKQ